MVLKTGYLFITQDTTSHIIASSEMNADNAPASETEHIYIKNVESTVYTKVQSIDCVSNSSFFIFPLVIEVIACIQNVLSSFINLSTEAILGLESYWVFLKRWYYFSKAYSRSVSDLS